MVVHAGSQRSVNSVPDAEQQDLSTPHQLSKSSTADTLVGHCPSVRTLSDVPDYTREDDGTIAKCGSGTGAEDGSPATEVSPP